MKKTVKAIILVILGLIIWSTLMYMSLVFITAELDPFSWSKGVRSILVFEMFCYVVFSPLMVTFLKEEI